MDASKSFNTTVATPQWKFPSTAAITILASTLILLVFLFQKRLLRRKKKPLPDVTDEQVDDALARWEPEPLVPERDDQFLPTLPLSSHIIEGRAGKEIEIEGHRLLNLATSNFLGFVGNPRIEETARRTILKYGVGSCGPRSFYGTVDVHLELERQLADYMGCEEAVLYSYGFATMASAIPAYAKRGDVIYADKAVNFAIQTGIQASRSRVYWFEHNDMDDLQRLMREQDERDAKEPKKAAKVRRFIIVEGLYAKTGDLCPLPRIVELKWRYKTRIFIDESLSFGVVGRHGKGVTEHFGVDMINIDMVMASLENAIATTGGFCCGRSYVVYHQRLSGLGYIFSASLPPLLTTAASEALHIMHKEPERFERLHRNSKIFHDGLVNACKGTQFRLHGDEISPLKHMRYVAADKESGDKVLSELVARIKERGILVTKAAYLDKDEVFPVKPSVKITCNSELTAENCHRAIGVISDTIIEINAFQ